MRRPDARTCAALHGTLAGDSHGHRRPRQPRRLPRDSESAAAALPAGANGECEPCLLRIRRRYAWFQAKATGDQVKTVDPHL